MMTDNIKRGQALPVNKPKHKYAVLHWIIRIVRRKGPLARPPNMSPYVSAHLCKDVGLRTEVQPTQWWELR